MNWKEHAYLFTNGKFRFKDRHGNVIDIQPFYSTFGLTNIKDCTLIARKIEDMTDEEKSKIQEFSLDANFERGASNKFLYYLSFGVLPPQFEWDETVIDIKTL